MVTRFSSLVSEAATMQINLTLNDTSQTWDIPVNETLLDALR